MNIVHVHVHVHIHMCTYTILCQSETHTTCILCVQYDAVEPEKYVRTCIYVRTFSIGAGE